MAALDLCLRAQRAVVIGTTGHSDEQLTQIREEWAEAAEDAVSYWASEWSRIHDRVVSFFDHADEAYREAQRVLQYLGI